METIKNKYWAVFTVGAFFALTCIYNTFGENYNVFWNTYIKTVRELFLVVFIYKSFSSQNNPISILFSIGAISVSFSYTVFRFWCAVKSVVNFDPSDFDTTYQYYMSLMRSTDNRLIMSIVIFCILVSIKFIKSKYRV